PEIDGRACISMDGEAVNRFIANVSLRVERVKGVRPEAGFGQLPRTVGDFFSVAAQAFELVESRAVAGKILGAFVVRPGSRPLRLRKVLCRQQTPAPNACSEPLIGVHRLSIAARDRVAVKASPAPGSIARPQTFRIRLMAAKQSDSRGRDSGRNQGFRGR